MKTKLPIITVVGILLLAACAPATPPQPTPDVNSIRTSAAYTVVAEFTLTAAVLPTSAPPPTETAIPEELPTEAATEVLTTDPTLATLGTSSVLCDDYAFDPATVDVNIPDGTPMTPNQDFVKTWKIKNTGECTWGDGYKLIYSYGDRMNGQPAPLGAAVLPGQEIEVSVNFRAPAKVGQYNSYWQMVNPGGYTFGSKEDILYVKIVVP
jgi:hypothetical protein